MVASETLPGKDGFERRKLTLIVRRRKEFIRMNTKRVFVIGLDGATLDLIGPWIAQGELPAFAQLMREGVSGPLRSTIPALTPPAWTSSLTGKNPGKHNIFDFFKQEPGSYRKRIVSAQDRKSSAIWNILSDKGKKVGLLNVPLTFPPEKVEGFIVAGMLTPSPERDFVHPLWLKEELLEKVDYKISVNLKALLQGNEEAFLQELSEVLKRRGEAFFYLLKKFDSDFFMVVFETLDLLQHFFWKFIDQNHPQYNDPIKAGFRNAILNHYQELDEILKELIDTLGGEDTVVVYSDHGFGPLYKDVYINNWLEEKAFLALKRNLEGWKRKYLIKKGVLPKIVKKMVIGDSQSGSKLISAIQWKKTKAYFFSLSGQSIRINLKGREPEGIVSEGAEYEGLRDRLIQALRELRDPATGEQLVKEIVKREDVYFGSFVHNAPDLLVEMKEGYALQEGFGEDLIMPARQSVAFRSGDHRSDGILFIEGPGIRKGVHLSSAEMVDIAPTLLHILGIPIPGDMDGKVLKEAFDETYLRENPIQFDESATSRNETDYEFSKEEAEILKKQLRGLGYLE
jgi:predicted AlkP superfamily phosphohydrolase/phosphomutase